MVTMWRVDSCYTDREPEPHLVECEIPEYPNRDSDGRTICDNTHFQDKSHAWAQLLSEAQAGVSLTSAGVRSAERTLARAKEELCKRALFLNDVMRGIEDST